MKKIYGLAYPFLGIFAAIALASDMPARVLSLSATSQGAGSADAGCVLKNSCASYWTPDARDRGVDEGIDVQFEKPISLGAIEVVSDVNVSVSVNGNKLASSGTEQQNGSSVGRSWIFMLGQSTNETLKEEVKSVFVRIAPPDLDSSDHGSATGKIYAIHFFKPFPSSAPLPLSDSLRVVTELPVIVDADVQASSVLDPRAAYQPANLFDGRNDFAWATNGKKTSGVHEWVDVQFTSPLTLTGILVWNGYQRSDTHYQANGRVADLTLAGDNHQTATVHLKDARDMQELHFEQPLTQVSKVRLTIDQIYAGKKYPDVLLSELRFLDDQKNIVLPKVNVENPPLTPALAKYLNRSYASAICPRADQHCFTYSFRLRKNGSFVVYRESCLGEGEKETVWEGNWTEQEGHLRLFGKRYSSSGAWADINYGLAEQRSPVEIFQTDIVIHDLTKLTAQDKERVFGDIAKTRGIQPQAAVILRPGKIAGLGREKSIADLGKMSGVIVVESPLFTDLFAPTDSGLCPD